MLVTGVAPSMCRQALNLMAGYWMAEIIIYDVERFKFINNYQYTNAEIDCKIISQMCLNFNGSLSIKR